MPEIPLLHDLAVAALLELSDSVEIIMDMDRIIDRLAGSPEFKNDKFKESVKDSVRKYWGRKIMAHLGSMLKPGELAVVYGLEKNTDLNEKRVSLLCYNAKKKRWAVDTTESKILVKPCNLYPLVQPKSNSLSQMLSSTAASMRRSVMKHLMETNDREGCWRMIRAGYRACPLLVLSKAFEINDITAPRTTIVDFARQLQRVSGSEAKRFAQRMQNALKRSLPGYQRPPGPFNLLYFPEDHEKVESADIPVLHWFMLYAHLDGEDFLGAMKSLANIFQDIASGHCSKVLLPEALYHVTLAEFCLGNTDQNASRFLAMYDCSADALDRHRRDAAILRMGIDRVTSETFSEALLENGELQESRARLSSKWGSELFSSTPWVHWKVAQSLGAPYENPYQRMIDIIEEQWNNMGISWRPQNVEDIIAEMKAPGCPHGVTVRYRMPRSDQERERVDGERLLQWMYEDR